MNTRQVKKIINTLVALLLLLLISLLLISFINKPEIKDIRFTNLDKIKNSNIEAQNAEVTNINKAEFDYIIVGYRFGEANSSVILKKGSKEFVLYEGDILENTYELVSVSPDEIVLSASGKLYKLENKVGK
jgi:type II secretory pathway component PulC